MSKGHDKLDCMIMLAARNYVDPEVESFDNPSDDEPVVFSSRYERIKKKKIRAYKRRQNMVKVKKITRYAAIGLLVLLSVAFITVMSVSAFSNAVIDAVVDFFDDYVKVDFSGSATPSPTKEPPSSIETVKRITALPEGVVEEVSRGEQICFTKYYLGNKKILTLSQEVITQNNVLLDNSEQDVQILLVNSYRAYKFKMQEDLISVCWSDGEYVYRIICYDDNFDIITLAESVR